MISRKAEILLALIRTSFGRESGDFSIPENLPWGKLWNLAYEQGVSAIVADAVQKLYDRPGGFATNLDDDNYEDLRYELLSTPISYEDTWKAYLESISSYAAICADAGLPMMILKGYGLSLFYPKPLLRTCGDVDVWMRGEYERVDDFFYSKTGIRPERSSHHSIFEFKGFKYENHITILDIESHSSNLRCEKELQELSKTDFTKVELGGRELLLPGAEFNCRYLLKHSAEHFAVEKMSLRQLLDWGFFVENSHFDWDGLRSFVRREGMTRFLDCLNGICVRYLGFDPAKFPIIVNDEALQDRVLSDMITPEFDDKIPSEDKLVSYAIAKTRRMLVNRWKYAITSSESLISLYLRFARKSLRRRHGKG